MPPDHTPGTTVQSHRLKAELTVFIGLLLVAFVGLYLFVTRFGLYEDDYYFTVGPYLWNWAAFKAYLFDAWHSWPQFRPLGFSLTYVITYATAQFDSLLPAYGLGLLLNSVNGYLFYRLARKVVRHWIAFAAACVFLLYPADTSKAILMLRGFELANLTMVLSAILLYVNGRRFPAYLLACCCLLTYEHFFLPILVAPFIVEAGRRFSWKGFASHWAICAILPAALMVARKLAGDVRSTAVIGAPGDALRRMVSACVIGPRTALSTMVDRPWDALFHSTALQWSMIAVGAVIVVWIAVRARTPRPESGQGAAGVRWAVTGGLICFALGYVIAILPENYPPVVNIGRLSGFNAPASVSACLFLAALAEWILNRTRFLEKTAILAAAIYVGLLVSAGIQVQITDYVASWRAQRQFWTTILSTSGEWHPGTAILVDVNEAPRGSFDTVGFPRNWMVYDALMGTRDLMAPAVWHDWTARPKLGSAPTVFGIWKSVAWKPQGDRYRLDTPPGFEAVRQPLVANGTFLHFGFRDGLLVRTDAPVMLHGLTLHPIPAPAKEPPPRAFSRLYRILFSNPTPGSELDANPWPSLLRAKSYPK